MIRNPKYLLCILAIFIFCTTAQAQICKETDGDNQPNMDGGDPDGEQHGLIDCDMEYYNAKITCDKIEVTDQSLESGASGNSGNTKRNTRNTRPSCPSKPMPMIKTPLKSFIKDYSPYLYAYARDKNDRSLAYNGPFSVGTAGGSDRVFGMITNAAPGSQAEGPGDIKRFAACVPQIDFPKGASSIEEEAKQVRLQLDNCTNQYILHAAIYPFQKSRSRLLEGTPQDKGGKQVVTSDPISPTTECQPIKTFNEEENEYKAGEYIEAAWRKLLIDPKHRKNKMAWAEPHLPDGIQLKNPIQPPQDNPFPFSSLTLSSIAAIKAEEIIDPSHPYTPRWDFAFNERDRYSPLTDEYMKQTTSDDGKSNVVLCAGVKEAKNESDAKKKEDLEVKVDVLSFRQKKFEEGIMARINFNTACKRDEGDKTYNRTLPDAIQASYCYEPNWVKIAASWGTAAAGPNYKKIACWKCFGLNDKVDDETEFPPCSTRHDGKDGRIKKFPYWLPGLKNGMSLQASCNPNIPYTRNPKHNIKTLCEDLRRPFTPINKLKMRYHNVDEPDYDPLKDGAPEGYTFYEYFGNHMPYPRLWDTGKSLQTNTAANNNTQPPNDTKGQHTTIVGVGREGAIEKADDTAKKKHEDQRCKMGGWGEQSFNGHRGYMVTVITPVANNTVIPQPPMPPTPPGAPAPGAAPSQSNFPQSNFPKSSFPQPGSMGGADAGAAAVPQPPMPPGLPAGTASRPGNGGFITVRPPSAYVGISSGGPRFPINTNNNNPNKDTVIINTSGINAQVNNQVNNSINNICNLPGVRTPAINPAQGINSTIRGINGQIGGLTGKVRGTVSSLNGVINYPKNMTNGFIRGINGQLNNLIGGTNRQTAMLRNGLRFNINPSLTSMLGAGIDGGFTGFAAVAKLPGMSCIPGLGNMLKFGGGIQMPRINMRMPQVPGLNIPGIFPGLPKIPGIQLPKIPGVNLNGLNALQMLGVNIPNMQIPRLQMPQIPSFNFNLSSMCKGFLKNIIGKFRFQLPKIKIPGLNNLLAQLGAIMRCVGPFIGGGAGNNFGNGGGMIGMLGANFDYSSITNNLPGPKVSIGGMGGGGGAFGNGGMPNLGGMGGAGGGITQVPTIGGGGR